MKKILTVFFAAVVATCTHAQFFQSTYGTADNDFLSSGINTRVQPVGHFMAGNTPNPGAPYRSLAAVYTDATGAIPGAPHFNSRYDVISLAGIPLDVINALTFEMDNGAGFGIVGHYTDAFSPGTDIGIYYYHLDPIGNTVAVYDYTPVPSGATNWDVTEVSAIAESTTGSELYITGGVTVTGSAGVTHVFAIKIDVATGAIIWSQIYDLAQSGTLSREIGKDIVESPYTPLGNPEVVVVGIEHGTGTGSTLDGFILRIDANTGLLSVPWATVFGSSTSNDYFTSITVSNSTAGGNVGFVIGGTSNYGGDDDYWLVKTDATCGSTLWATLHDYSVNTGNANGCWDVVERFNTSNQYEYYMGGYVFNGAFGNEDALVIKTDDWGNGVVNGEFTYGTTGADDCRQLDQYNGTGSDGLSTFGNTNFGFIGLGDFYHVKSYFSGESHNGGNCNDLLSNPSPVTGPGLYSELSVNHLSTFSNALMVTGYVGKMTDAQPCYTTFIQGASNARIAPKEPKTNNAIIISPNPMAGPQIATVEIEAQQPANVLVRVYDMLGKQYYNYNHTLAKGNNKLPVDLSNTTMCAGIYTVKIIGDNLNKNILLLVK